MSVRFVFGMLFLVLITGLFLYINGETKTSYTCKSELDDIEMSITEYNWLMKILKRRDGLLHLKSLNVKEYPAVTMTVKFNWVERWSRLDTKDIVFDWRFSQESGDLTIKSKVKLFDGNCEILSAIT